MLKRARQNTGSWNGSSDLFPGAPAPRPPRPSVFDCPANLLPSCSRVPYPLPIRLSLLFPVPVPFSSVSYTRLLSLLVPFHRSRCPAPSWTRPVLIRPTGISLSLSLRVVPRSLCFSPVPVLLAAPLRSARGPPFRPSVRPSDVVAQASFRFSSFLLRITLPRPGWLALSIVSLASPRLVALSRSRTPDSTPL